MPVSQPLSGPSRLASPTLTIPSCSTVHAKGSFVYLQLWALGRAATADVLKKEGNFDVVSSSDVLFEGGATPRPLTEAEIQQYVKDYAAAANAFVERAGGDGVESESSQLVPATSGILTDPPAAVHGANGYLIDQFTQTTSNKRTDKYGGSVENRTRFGLQVVDAVVAAVGPTKTGIRMSPFTDFQGMKMPTTEAEETFSFFASEIKRKHPQFAYLHLVEPRASGIYDAVPGEHESLDFLAKIWSPSPLLIAGGHKLEDADRSAAQYENSLAVYGRYFISNPDLVARIRHKVEFAPYDRSLFYKLGPHEVEGYTTYPVVYGPEGKL